MEFLRSKGIPLPKIYGYSASTNNPAWVEYIFMEQSSGRLLSEVWDDMEHQDRHKILAKIIEMENRLFGIRLPASGSLYYLKDLPQGIRGTPIDHHDAEDPFSLHIGPSTSTHFWFGRRSELSVDRRYCPPTPLQWKLSAILFHGGLTLYFFYVVKPSKPSSAKNNTIAQQLAKIDRRLEQIDDHLVQVNDHLATIDDHLDTLHDAVQDLQYNCSGIPHMERKLQSISADQQELNKLARDTNDLS
ncbi:hypothetical protein PRZ48_006495 [Zasmidium cellare]|uniref:Aminoglycoside phosphotransferase domain-containing protein n=1 Tax=Zasmidium cellare TaxID=395010 RepID=A0ABR0EPP9_ZASCE|nr:hypothetical protein PRZ48_006495 [Zasmidium cellare]